MNYNAAAFIMGLIYGTLDLESEESAITILVFIAIYVLGLLIFYFLFIRK